MNWIFSIGKWAASFLVGGSLDKILDTIENKMDNETKKEEIKAEVTKTWINAQTQLLVGRTWWFQLFFVLPAGMYWSSLLYVSAAPDWMPTWTVDRLPGWAEEIYLAIVSALFIVDGGKALLNKMKGGR
jgi:hypothetical protein